MILSDIGRSPESVLRQINRHLQVNYGLVITENADYNELAGIADRVYSEIVELKLGGRCANTSPEISQRLLILEGLKTLTATYKSPDYDTLVDQMANCVVDYLRRTSAEDSEENFNDAVKDAMRIYRSSEYQFPDFTVETAIRDAANIKLGTVTQVPMDMVDTHYGSDDNLHSGFGIDDNEFDFDTVSTGSDYDTTEYKDTRMFERQNMIKQLRHLMESKVSQAEVMMAAKGFAQELQEMVEKVGRLQNEDLPPVTDQMRETYNTDSASAFQTLVYSAMQQVMDALYTAKGQIDDAVENMALRGRVDAQTDMDIEQPDMDVQDDEEFADYSDEADVDLDNVAGAEPDDEFGAAEEEEPLGRSPKMESVKRLERQIAEMRELLESARSMSATK